MDNILLMKSIGELIGSFMLSFAVFMAVYTTKQESFGLDTKLKKRSFLAVVLALAVTMSITIAFAIGRSG
jgi:predicted neutral ceramidase superfamily lipid hydrolase